MSTDTDRQLVAATVDTTVTVVLAVACLAGSFGLAGALLAGLGWLR